ncbi:MAG: hypothetical protein O2904_04425 [bacterium]|nr:hypothetical protein [bacterium]
MNDIQLNSDNALAALISVIKQGKANRQEYDVHADRAVREYLIELGCTADEINKRLANQFVALFADAAWELVRLGVLRLGAKNNFWNAQILHNGNTDNFGFSLTEYGKEWLEKYDQEDFVPIEPNAFGKLIEKYGTKFGTGFLERAAEANKCYRTGAYNACTAMCGAAAESIILNLVIAKDGNEENVIKDYKSAGGREKMKNILLGAKATRIKQHLNGLFDLLSYWRDESAHGIAMRHDEYEAQSSIHLLIKYAKFAESNYKELTS